MKKFSFLISIKFLLLIVSVILNSYAFSQALPKITHFSVENGLSENHILSMMQDRKGYMWFGTNDGLNRFDGYTFRCFKGKQKDLFKLLNFRVNRIIEDLQGYIWIQTDDNRIYRFDPESEKFLAVPQCLKPYENYDKALNRIQVMNDSSVWLFSGKKSNTDIFCVHNISDENDVNIKPFKLNVRGDDRLTNKIFQDKDFNTWFLTSQGMEIIKRGTTELYSLNNLFDGDFICSAENKQFNFFGAAEGNLIIYDKKMQMFNTVKLPVQSTILEIIILNYRELLILVNKNFFYTYNLESKSFQEYKTGSDEILKLRGSYYDKNNKVWIDTDIPGIMYFDLKTRKLNKLGVQAVEYAFPNNPRFTVLDDNLKNKWFLTFEGGFYRYNTGSDMLEDLIIGSERKNNLSNQVHQAMSDNQGNIWLNTYQQGVDKIVFQKHPFSFTKIENKPGYFAKKEIRSVFEDCDGLIWIGSKKGYVFVYDKHYNLIGQLGSDGKINGSVPFNSPVYNILQDSKGVIWLATKGTGLYSLVKKSPGNYQMTQYAFNENDIYSISSDFIYAVYEDKQSQIWVGTFGGGLNLIDSSSGKIRFLNNRNIFKKSLNDFAPKIRCIAEDKNGQLLVGTTNGLYVSGKMKNKAGLKFKHYQYRADAENTMLGSDVHFIHATQNGDVYISTIGGGVNVVRGGFRDNSEPVFEILESVDKEQINAVYTIKSDKRGNLWMSAQKQILCLNPVSRKLDVYDPESEERFFIDEAAVCQTSRGEIIYGTSNGFISFNPLLLKKSTYIPQLVFTGLKLFDNTVGPGEKDSPLKKALDYTNKLILNHDQSTFTIEFAAIDYQNPERIRYAYKMEGFESNWNYTGTQRQATYINLPKGNYIFKVKSTNSDGMWVNNERTIIIEKKPSFWESYWGFLFYLVIFIVLTLTVVYVLFTFYRLRNEVSVEHRISSAKLRFFTDISHELRTPLTLIAAPVENILKKENLSPKVRSQLITIQKNTDRMLRLINQILDFRKIQNNKMNLIVEKVDVKMLLEDICNNFLRVAEEKKIDLQVSGQLNEHAVLWVDKDKFDKIIFNLLSNAFKFSSSGKKIELMLREDPDNIIISIIDQGIGISKDKLKYLFDRFESIANTGTGFQASTGIGLSLTKELIEMHKAEIQVESDPGMGTVFNLTFKKGVEHYRNSGEIILTDSEDTEFKADSSESYPESEENTLNPVSTENERDLKKILIVEDNTELRNFLKTILSENYEVIEADNGNKAFELTLSSTPDLIISDIMMPDMDGLQLAAKIKGDMNISHTPLILLTAKIDTESKLKALEYGVDDYITKPFSSAYLEARIENLLKLRMQLQQYFRSSLTSGVISIAKPELIGQDEVFISKTMMYIEENYENSEMNVEDIALNLGMSRSSFFKKLKSLTGIAPVDFVREFRIQRALQMMDAGETNISQISFSVGINDARYFSKCFKQKFGINPSEYKSRIQQ